jgi:MFS family permease
MTEKTGGWGELLRGGHAVRSLVVAGGIAMHSINVFITITILPTVVRDIGGLEYFAWNTTLYVIASVLAGGMCARILPRLGARNLYRAALALFMAGSVLCALAPSMPALLAGRMVQGLGAGTLSALSYSMVRVLFPERLWPPALSIISAAWGIATLGGPAVGGLFAQYGAWRMAFWSVAAVAPVLWLVVERSLPADVARPPRPPLPMAYASLGLLCASVFCVSLGSAATRPAMNALGFGAALAGIALFVRLENGGGRRLMPAGACRITTPLGATYAAMLLLIIAINTEIFVPYFLQTLHGMAPVNAGYLSALMSAGWTTGAVGLAGASRAAAPRWMVAGPLTLAASLAAMFVLMPHPGLLPEGAQIGLLGLCLFAQGCGIGMGWPHVCAGVFGFAPEGEKDLAAASMTLVIMMSNALGSALAGMLANLAGLGGGGAAGAASASAWLFGVYAMAPLLAVLAIRRVLAARPV